MTQPTTEPPVVEPAAPATDPVAAKPTLEEMLADLDEDRRTVLLGEVSKARGEAKSLRERLKAAEPKVAELDRLTQASKTDADRAQEALAAAESRAAAATQRVARAEVKAALAGVVTDPDALIDDLNLAKFVDADGEIDVVAISGLRQKYAALGGRRAPLPDGSQASGANGSTAPTKAEQFAQLLQKSTSSL
jgi:hypothetical protein